LPATDTRRAAARWAAKRLLEEGVIPVEERIDALIIAEAAAPGCQLLISSDSDVRDADPSRLARALRESGVPMVIIRKPGDIARMFAER